MPCIDQALPPQPAVGNARGRRRLAAWALAIAALLAGCASAPPQPVPGSAAALAVARDERAARALPPPPAARTWDEFQRNAAHRLVAAHPDGSYLGPVPEPLLGIPVLEVELDAGGQVRSIKVLREPRDAKETIAMAIAAVKRAAPYGDMTRLSRPWRFVEVFLYDDDYRFKPATLDR